MRLAGSLVRPTIAFALLVAMAYGATAAEPGPPLVPVAPGTSIQAAIDSAPAGAVLRLEAGEYAETVTIDKSVTLRGPDDGEARWTGTEAGCVLHITGEGVTVGIERLTIHGARGYDGHGIAVDGAAVAELVEVLLIGNAWFGLQASEHSEATLVDCSVRENGSAGLISEDFARLRVVDCDVCSNTSHGLLALHLSDATIERSEIGGNWAGIWAWDASRVSVAGSYIAGNVDYGAIVSTAALLVLQGTTVTGSGHHGLLFEESSRGVLRDSFIHENGADGLFAEGDAILEIDRCTFAKNGRAGLRVAWGERTGGFDPKRYFAGRIEGAANVVPEPGEPEGNGEAALCPAPPALWPNGFLEGM